MPQRPRITLADIAREVGLSVSAVSLALRNSKNVRESTRQRVQETAKRLGYRLDPSLGKLMTYLRRSRQKPKGIRATLCGLVFEKDSSEFVLRYIQAASRMAEAHGYRLCVEQVPEREDELRLHERSLCSRGVEGLLFLPSKWPVQAEGLYDWSQFALVSASANPQLPEVDRVLVNWHNAVRQTALRLNERGYHRIGFVVGGHLDFLFKQLFTSALLEHQAFGVSEPVEPFFYLPKTRRIPAYLNKDFLQYFGPMATHPLTRKPIQFLSVGLASWYAIQRPDIVVFDCVDSALAGLRCLPNAGSIHVALLCRPPDSPLPGVTHQVELVAETAVELLCTRISHGKFGLPAFPFEQLFRGRWHDGRVRTVADSGLLN